jgi:hypothetical protein
VPGPISMIEALMIEALERVMSSSRWLPRRCPSIYFQPLLRSPAEIPLIVSWITRSICSLGLPARLFFISSI